MTLSNLKADLFSLTFQAKYPFFNMPTETLPNKRSQWEKKGTIQLAELW